VLRTSLDTSWRVRKRSVSETLLCTRDLWTLGQSARRETKNYVALVLDEFDKLSEYHLTERKIEKLDNKVCQNVTL
jgi:hypothetical protein